VRAGIRGEAPSPAAAAFAGTLVLAAAMGIGRFAYTPLLPVMQEALGWSVAQAGDVAAANFLGYFVGALVAARLAASPARRRWLVAAFMASAATTLAGVVTESFAAWLVVRFLSGVASAFCLVIGTAVIFEFLANRGASQWSALHFAGVGSGIALSVVVLEAARVAGASMSGQWGALGISAAVLFAAAALIVRPIPEGERTAAAVSARASTPSTGPLTRLIVAYGLYGFGYVVTATFIVAIAPS
jgi:MFS family permease